MSTYSRIPLMYHPTNVVLLDDDPKFLNDVCLILADNIPYVVDDDPQKIMNYLEGHTYQPDSLSALVTQQVFDSNNGKPGAPETFSIDFSRLRETLSLPTRFKISVVGGVDRLMKKMDGIDFCRSIRAKGLSIKIILFTGKTSADEAVKFFNEKVIDGFLVKQGEDIAKLTEKINATILEHAWQQFIDLGEILSGLLSHVLKPLQDKQFIQIFEKIRQLYKIVEFYLLDSSCSFLILNAAGEAKQLFVRNETDFKDCYEIAKDAKAPYDVLQALRGRQMFPYTAENMGYTRFQHDAWDDIMVQMDKVPGRELYYAVIDRPDIKAFSFDQYLQKEWPTP